MDLMNSLRLRLLLPSLASLGLWVPATGHAANLIVNGEFISGMTGWRTVGTVFDAGQTGVLTDQGGSYIVLFQTVAVPLQTTLSLMLQYDLFGALSPVAGLGQTPDTVFLAAFLGASDFGPGYATGIYDEVIGVMDLDFRGPANPALGLLSGPSPKGQGWTRYTLALPVSGYVTVAFEFVDGNGIVGDSTAAVDNVVLEAVPIPEPGTPALAAVLGAAFLRRRRGRLYLR